MIIILIHIHVILVNAIIKNEVEIHLIHEIFDINLNIIKGNEDTHFLQELDVIFEDFTKKINKYITNACEDL
jgi:hypothetical protein